MELGIGGEEEEEEPRCEIGFLEGTYFLATIDKKLKREDMRKET